MNWKNEKRKLNELKEMAGNPRKETEKQAQDLAQSLKKFNLVDPIIINQDNTVIGGHFRRKVLIDKYGKDYEVDVRVADRELNRKEVEELNLRLNRNTGEWNWDLLANFDEEILKDIGFDSEELGKIFEEVEEDDFDAEEEYNKIGEPKTKLGDVYQLGEHRLICGDATKRKDIEKLMGGRKADIVYTDPPYNVGYDYWGFRGTRKKGFISKKVFNDKKKPEEYQQFIKNSFHNAFDFSKNYSSVYCWHGTSSEREVKNGLIESGWHISQTIIWLKNSIVLSIGQDYHRIYEPCYFGWKKGQKHLINKKIGNKWSEVIILDREDFQNYFDVFWEHRDKIVDYEHPTQKPVRLAERAIKRHSERGFIILDTFGGSGSTLIACEQLNRRCYMMELDPIYCDVIVNRWTNYTKNRNIIKNNQSITWDNQL